MEHQAQQAIRLVDDLFDLCAGGLGKLSLCKEVVALADVVTRAAETAGPTLAARRHRVTVSLPREPVFLEADPLRLTQVLTNLLSNAAKCTDPGGHIQLSAEVQAGQVILRVRDNGRGIAPELLPRLFLGSRADTIYGGTNQIQRNIIAERALGLPRESRS